MPPQPPHPTLLPSPSCSPLTLTPSLPPLPPPPPGRPPPQVLHPLAMQPAIRSGSLSVRVKNSYNRSASGTIITSQRDLSDTVVTSIVLKPNVTMVDVHSTRMLGAHGEGGTARGARVRAAAAAAAALVMARVRRQQGAGGRSG